MKTDLPSQPFDRIAELEAQVAELRQMIAPTARAARMSHLDQPILAITEEIDDVAYPEEFSHRLPVLVQAIELSSGGDAEFINRTSSARTYAASPFGWLPPKHRVHLVHRFSKWEIVRCENKLFGRVVEELEAAEWIPEDTEAGTPARLKLGRGKVQIYRRVDEETEPWEEDLYEPLLYRDDSPVVMTWWNRMPFVIPEDGQVYAAIRNADNDWVMLPEQDLIGGCLEEDHPGRGDTFKIHLGTWNPASHTWEYDLENEHRAIDHRFDVPYPDRGATGLFRWRRSDEFGIIWEVVTLDCSSPGPCDGESYEEQGY